MGLFSRKKREHEAEPLTAPDPSDSDTDLDLGDDQADGAVDDANNGAEEAPEEALIDTSHLDGGPFDEPLAPEGDRIDLGGLQIPMIHGMELRMEVDQRTQAVTGVNLIVASSSLQLQAFAAPKSRGLWTDVRSSLRSSVVEQGGTAETRPGPFGTELIARLPMKRADGRTGYRRARFVGIDGPRWFLRAVITGKALVEEDRARAMERLLSQVVVVRGSEAMAPQELIPLNLPGQRPGLIPQENSPLNPLERGPEITEVG